MALCLIDWNRELSSPPEALKHPLRMSSVARLIRLVNHHFNNLPDRAHRVVNVYSKVIYLQKEAGRKEPNHQCFISTDLWIFKQQRSSSHASQANLGEACWELSRVCGLLVLHPPFPSHADFFCLIIVNFMWIFDISLSWPCHTVAILPPFSFIHRYFCLFSCISYSVAPCILNTTLYPESQIQLYIKWSTISASLHSLHWMVLWVCFHSSVPAQPLVLQSSLCFLLSHCRPSLSNQKRASSSGTVCCVLDGWHAR